MKKKYTAILAILMILLCFTSCTKKTAAEESHAEKKLSVVATIFPEYDWVREVLKDEVKNVDLTLLMANGVDLHSFQPSVQDILKISTCDLFIYVGGESDEWVEDVLSEAKNKDMKVINLLEALGDKAKEEELIEGMEAEEEEEVEGEEEEGIEYDEHVWLSLKNAEIFVSAIADTLSELDSAHASLYHANAEAYKAKLSALDEKYQAAVDAGTYKTVLFGDRFPFRYLTDDYGLDYYAAFLGCSAESEASFETIAFLAGKVNELDLHTVLVIESADKKIAETIVNNTEKKNQTICVMDSMQSISTKDVGNGVSYLSIMENNLNVLSDSLK